jgi:biotin operon repressor
MTAVEARVLATLRAGPSTIDDLRFRLGYTRRDVEEAVETLRLAGEPIVGGTEGLRLTEDPEELAAYLEARRRRMASIYLGSRSLRRTLRGLRDRRAASEGLTLWS